MFWRAWLRSLAVKRPQSLLAFAALALEATVASLLLNVYGGARRKMQSEFRSDGPNVVVAPANSGVADGSAVSPAGLIDSGTVERVQAHLRTNSTSPDKASPVVAVPVLYAVVLAGSPKAPHGPLTSLVAVGAELAALYALNPAWKLSLAPDTAFDNLGSNRCLIGSHAAARLELTAGDTLELEAAAGGSAPAGSSTAAGTRAFTVAGLVSSGGSEDDQVFLPLDPLQEVTGLGGKVSLVEMRLPGTASEVESAIGGLRRGVPSVEVRPVREIVQTEGKVLSTIQSLLWALAALILGVVVLCVMATVTTIMLHRRKEVAVMKALGASDRAVAVLFLAEIVALGIAGGLVGFAAGALLARRLGVDLFGVPLSTDWSAVLPVLLAAVLAAALPALLPVSTIRGIDPAHALKGE